MVQLKSQDIASQKDAKDQQNMIVELENKAASAQNKCLMLDHTIADKDAQLKMEGAKTQNVVDELQSLQQVADALDAKLQEDEDAVMGLNPALNCFRDWQNSHQERMRSIATKLGAFEQRVSFATSRIDVLKGLFARKEALLKIQMSQSEQGKKTTSSSYVVDVSTSPDYTEESVQLVDRRMSYDELIAELERVKKERSNLAERIKDDAKYFEETLQSTKDKLESKIAELEETSRNLEKTVEEMTQQIESQGSEFEEKEASLMEATDTISKLKVDIAKLHVGADKASKERCEVMESQYKSQLMEMEQRVNEARREHAKAVVSLRQLERQHAREKDRSAEMLKIQEEQSKLDIGRLTNQLKDVERDKNLLMATLRQEGLINQYKAQRAVAKKMPPDKESVSDNQDVSAQDTSKQPAAFKAGRQVQQKKDSLNTMIADIRTLTQQVLLDKDDDNEEEEDRDK
ncbi:coiled-coil alpha-helical rod protein 1-like [Amphiura filiformis]|uniref:coiled-coil alpha-helical rod protein 1-like n=1 Tax=Amphiura filiformis TaxID=82378 RepID=UPI003B214F54